MKGGRGEGKTEWIKETINWEGKKNKRLKKARNWENRKE